MPDNSLEEMLDAHVRFEMDRWSHPQRSDSIGQEVQAFFDWAGTVPLESVADPQVVAERVETLLERLEATSQVRDLIIESVRTVRRAASDDDTLVTDLVRREDYDRFAATAIGMTDLQHAIIAQVTTSDVYSELIAHVLYTGIKGYLMTESPLVRRVPGASSLMRLGQTAMNSAAPNLEKSIDKQLTAFVNANIQDSIRDSRQYLDTMLDPEVLTTVTDEVWNANSEATVADAVGLVPDDVVDELVEAGLAAWDHLRTGGFIARMASALIDDLFARYGEWTLGEILAEASVSVGEVTDWVEQFADPVIDRMIHDGYLEGRIRQRLAAFYASYAT